MSARPQMSCRELVELITEYLEGVLPDSDRRRFEEHLGACEGCTEYLAQMRMTIDALGELPEEALSPESRQVLLDAFRDWRR